jgi:hypothetical protein
VAIVSADSDVGLEPLGGLFKCGGHGWGSIAEEEVGEEAEGHKRGCGREVVVLGIVTVLLVVLFAESLSPFPGP